MIKTILGVFREKDNVVMAINTLKEKGFDAKDISIVMRNASDAKDIEDDTGADVAGGAVSGATTGALLGGLAGLVAAFVIPGLGAFFIGGPIASALGLTGAAASTVSGAATGALAGGLLGALMGWGLSEDEAKEYETRVREGAILVAVPVSDANEETARNILEEFDASDIKSFTQSTETMRSGSTKRTYADADQPEKYERFAQPDPGMYAAAGTKGGRAETKKTGKKGGRTQDSGSFANPAQLQKHLKNVDYPCSKEDLMQTAQRDGADNTVMNTLRSLPETTFDSPTDVSEALGKLK
jgi:uncharacterized membrane protein